MSEKDITVGSVMKSFLKEFEERYPGFTIGKIEIWSMDGAMSWKRTEARSNWQARKREEIACIPPKAKP